MAEEASSSYNGLATDVPSSTLVFTFQAGQAGRPQHRHGGRHAKPHKHASPLRMSPGDKTFPSFPASPNPAMTGMQLGSAARSGSRASANRTPMDSAPLAFQQSPGPALNGMHAGVGAKAGNAGKTASADGAAQLPPRFASAVNISEGPAATPAAAQHRSPHSAARPGHRTAAQRRVHFRTPGGGVGMPGGESPFLREGSPMDWSPSVPEPAAPTPAGISGESVSRDEELDGLHADLAASSLSGEGNKQQAQLNEAFSSGFNMGRHSDGQGSQLPAQPAAESAASPKSQGMGSSGGAAAEKTPARPPFAKHAEHGHTGASQPSAAAASKNGSGEVRPEGQPAAQGADHGTAGPGMPSAGHLGQSGQPHSAASHATAAVPGTGGVGSGRLDGRSLSPDSSADSGLPHGVLHHGLTRSPAKGHSARTSHLSQVAKQMRDARLHIRVDIRPGMTLKDFRAAAKARASSKSNLGTARMQDDDMAANGNASQTAEAEAANGQTKGHLYTSENYTAAADKGQAWRSYRSSQTGTPQESSPAHGVSTQQEASSGSRAWRPRPATADLDEYLSRQHHMRSEAPADDVVASKSPASAAGHHRVSVQKARPSSAGSVSHTPLSSSAHASQAKAQADRHKMPASNAPADTSAGASHTAEQGEHVSSSGTSSAGAAPVPKQSRTEAGTGSFTFAFDQQGASDGSKTEHQPGLAMPGTTQEPSLPQSSFSFGGPPAAGRSTAGKAQPKVQRSPKRSTAQPGRPGYRPGGTAPVFMFSSPASSSSQEASQPFSTPPPFTFGSAPTAERAKQAPKMHSSSSAWPTAGLKQPQPAFTASASAGPAGLNPLAEGSPSSSFAAFTGQDDMAWALPSPLPSTWSGTFSSGQGPYQANSKPESKPSQHSHAAPDQETAESTANKASAPWAAPSGTNPFSHEANQDASIPAVPSSNSPAAGPAAARAVEGASRWPAAAPFAPDSLHDGHAPASAAQKEPVFMFGKQPEPQRAAADGPPAQQQPEPGSARARGFTFNLGSQNVPPTQNRVRPFKVRSARYAAKSAAPQPSAAGAEDTPRYTQPAPRRSIPVRCSNPFEGSTQGTPAASGSPATAAEAAHSSPEQDVEKLRQRGNDAFQRGNYNRAAELYKRAVKQHAQLGTAEGLGKLHSNLAACYLQQERFTKAVQACQCALQAEPGFHKASIRLATCHMRLGDAQAARAALEADPRLAAHADVTAKLAEVEAHGSRISEAIKAAEGARSTSAAEAALARVDAMLQPDQAPGSQELRRLKPQLQLQLSRFEDAAGACRVTQVSLGEGDWHWWLALQAAFHQGELQDAINIISSRMLAATSGVGSFAIGVWKGAANQGGQQLGIGHAQDMMSSMRRMLELKEAGNTALKSSQGQLAVDHYSMALQLQHAPSIPFAAVLHANRAAARQSLGQHAEAIADCLRATALKSDYAKAHSRLAALLADIKHSSRAVDVLERLEGLAKGSPQDAADVTRRLRDARLAAKSGAVDHYKLLGLERSVSSDDVRRAYKRSALQLHPDKALAQCRFSVRLGDQGLELCSRSETEQRVRNNADWLFKCIAEAHTVLTDPAVRRQLDGELARQERHGGSTSAYQRARTASYRAAPTSRRRPQSPCSSYGTKTYGSHAYQGEPECPSREDYENCDDEYVPYSSGRWNYF